MPYLKDGDLIECPECHEKWEFPVQDYVLAEITGIDSETTELCGYCDAPIRIVRDAPDKYFVEAEE